MSVLQYVFFGGGIIFALVVVILLFFSRYGIAAANRMLAIACLALAWYATFHILYRSHLLLQVPLALGWGDPLAYLIAPCCFLYVRMVLNDETHLRKIDYLHFVPFAIHLLDNLHIILLSSDEKYRLIRDVINDLSVLYRSHYTIIPLWIYFSFRFLLSLIYMILLWRLLYRDHRRRMQSLSVKQTSVTRRWLWMFATMLTIFFIALATLSRPLVEGQAQSDLFSQEYISYYVVSILFFTINAQFFFFPEILYGMPRIKETPVPEPEPEPEPAVIEGGMVPETIEQLERSIDLASSKKKQLPVDKYKQHIERYFTEQQPYLQPKFSIQQMAVATGIPLHHLSYLLNNYYNKRFTDFVNEYRVHYVMKSIEEGALGELSLDGLSRKAGFSSRSNFSVTFKKFTGLTPTEYLQRIS